MRPWFLLDVNGVIYPDLSRRCRKWYCDCHPGWIRRKTWPDGEMIRVMVNPAHGTYLKAIAERTGAELAWATYWGHSANEWISPLLGLPKLPVVPIPQIPDEEWFRRPRLVTAGMWKAQHIAWWHASEEGGGGRPFVWIDDERDSWKVRERLPADADHLVIRVEPQVGLTEFSLMLAWAALDSLAV